MSAEILNSWKEIAAYTKYGIRTLQRWETERNFPVRRPRGKSRSAVIAVKSEVDLWFRTLERRHEPNSLSHSQIQDRLLKNRELMRTAVATLTDHCDILRTQLDRAAKLASAMQAISKIPKIH